MRPESKLPCKTRLCMRKRVGEDHGCSFCLVVCVQLDFWDRQRGSGAMLYTSQACHCQRAPCIQASVSVRVSQCSVCQCGGTSKRVSVSPCSVSASLSDRSLGRKGAVKGNSGGFHANLRNGACMLCFNLYRLLYQAVFIPARMCSHTPRPPCLCKARRFHTSLGRQARVLTPA